MDQTMKAPLLGVSMSYESVSERGDKSHSSSYCDCADNHNPSSVDDGDDGGDDSSALGEVIVETRGTKERHQVSSSGFRRPTTEGDLRKRAEGGSARNCTSDQPWLSEKASARSFGPPVDLVGIGPQDHPARSVSMCSFSNLNRPHTVLGISSAVEYQLTPSPSKLGSRSQRGVKRDERNTRRGALRDSPLLHEVRPVSDSVASRHSGMRRGGGREGMSPTGTPSDTRTIEGLDIDRHLRPKGGEAMERGRCRRSASVSNAVSGDRFKERIIDGLCLSEPRSSANSDEAPTDSQFAHRVGLDIFGVKGVASHHSPRPQHMSRSHHHFSSPSLLNPPQPHSHRQPEQVGTSAWTQWFGDERREPLLPHEDETIIEAPASSSRGTQWGVTELSYSRGMSEVGGGGDESDTEEFNRYHNTHWCLGAGTSDTKLMNGVSGRASLKFSGCDGSPLHAPIPAPGGGETGGSGGAWRRWLIGRQGSGWSRQRKFTVLEIKGGSFKRYELQTPELLRMVHYHNKNNRLEDTATGSLKLRDLRQVCSHTSSAGHRPSIEPRRNCILINLPPVRCLILHDRVLMIPFGYGAALSGVRSCRGSPDSHMMGCLGRAETTHTSISVQPNKFSLSGIIGGNGAMSGKGSEWGSQARFPSGYPVSNYNRSSHQEVSRGVSGGTTPGAPLLMSQSPHSNGKDDECGVSGPLSDAVRCGLNAEIAALVANLVTLSEIRSIGPFEFAALEAVLIDVCSRLASDFTPLKRHAQHAFELVNGVPSSTQLLHEITDLRRRMGSMNDKILGVKTALKEILDNEEDLRRLEISRFWEAPEERENPIESHITDDVELLLECYEQEVESMLKQCDRADDTLDDTLQIMELHLASVRNVFLKSELGLDIVGVVVTFVGAVAGIFGMNIRNGFEDAIDVFWPITMVMISLCAVSGLLVLLLFKRLKL
eukprot:GHVN01079064.1.p1 GENE.GHVN01079064.1~~GHVN01079064.1.p1  ORF type:complete len:940 (+),score=192.74 GHVN01079064.1:62-2881(+)